MCNVVNIKKAPERNTPSLVELYYCKRYHKNETYIYALYSKQ